MDPRHRIVTHLPLTELWYDGGIVNAQCRYPVGSAEVKQLLRSDLSFVIANIGFALRWIQGKDVFEFWRTEVSPRLVEPSDSRFRLENFPGNYCYTAQQWTLKNGGIIVVLETHH